MGSWYYHEMLAAIPRAGTSERPVKSFEEIHQ
jgi:hypothetical protein